MGGYDSTWRDFKPNGAKPAASTRDKVATDRGSRRGAARCIVTADLQLLDHAVAKDAKIDGTFFQSRAEAKRWIALNGLRSIGCVRNLRRQVSYSLLVARPDGLKEAIGKWTADFVYEELGAGGWAEVVEDVKPSGGHLEDLFKWKKLHWECQFGKTIRIYTGRRR